MMPKIVHISYSNYEAYSVGLQVTGFYSVATAILN